METTVGPVCGIENCRSRRYHLGPDGYTVCQNGHRRDVGPVIGDDDFREGASQAYAKTSRIQREAEVKADNFLGGREAMVMYLQCFQLILWKQANWLVKVKGYPQELETVIHDLWALRLQMLRELVEDPDEKRATQMFSTQSETDVSDGDIAVSTAMQAKLRQRAPTLIETVTLCYLSLVLMHLPVCSNDVLQWVMSEDFSYLRALQDLPQVMKQRLPLNLRGKFHVRTGPSELERLHATAANLVWAFQGSYGMKFPELNHHLLLFHFVSELALPLDVFPATEGLARLLDHKFAFPPLPSRRTLLRLYQYPEIKLLCSLVVVTKLFYPFDSASTHRHPTSPTSPAALVIDWPAWNEARAQHTAISTAAPTPRGGLTSAVRTESGIPADARTTAMPGTTEDDVFNMTSADADAYLQWFEKTWLGGGDGEGDQAGDTGDDERDALLAASSSGRLSAAETEFRRALFRMFPSGGDKEESGRTEQQTRTDNDSADLEAGEDETDESATDDDMDTDVHDGASQAKIDRIGAVQSTLVQQDVVPEAASNPEEENEDRGDGAGHAASKAQVLRPGSRYAHYRSFDEVPDVGKAFFEDAGRLVGLSPENLVVAVFQVEMKLHRWVMRKRRGENEDVEMGERSGD